MSYGASSPALSYSLAGAAVTGVSQSLFPAAAYNGFEERWVTNPSATATIWVNLFGGPAAANAEDNFSIPPGGGWSGKVSNAVSVLGIAGQPITAGQR
jgi:hypothetical protein